LIWHLLSVRIEESKFVLDVFEDKSVSVFKDGLVGEHLENLFKRCLTDTVLLNSKICLIVFKLTEQPSDCLALLWYSELVEISTLFKHLNLAKNIAQEVDSLESKSLSIEIGDKVYDTDLTCVQIGFKNKIFTNTFWSDLIKDNRIISTLSCSIDSFLKSDLILDILSKPKLFTQVLKLVIARLDNLNLNLISCSILVLDMLDSSEASKDTSSNHDSKFSSQSLTLLHRVSSDDDSTLLISLRDFLNNCPHELSCLRVHTCRRLVKKNDWWVTHGGHSDTKLSLITTTEGSSWFLDVIFEVKIFNQLLDDLFSLLCWDTFNFGIEV